MGKTAQLMLGAAARDIAQSDPDRGARLIDRIVTRFQSLTSPAAPRRLLSVLGNAGSVRALPIIERYLHDPATDMRVGAATALRFVDSPRADELLSGLLAADPE